MNQLKIGASLSYVTIVLTNIIGILLTPYTLSKLGASEYGLYTLMGAFIGYMTVLDFGLNNTIIRFVAKFRAEKDKRGEENFLAMSMIMYMIIATVVIIVGVILYYNLENIFGQSLKVDELRKAKIMFIILIFNLAITLPGGAFNAIASGYERFVFPKALNIAKYIVRSIMLVCLLALGGESVGIVVLDTCMNILVIGINVYFVLRNLKVRFVLHYFDLKMLKEILSYSVWIFVFAIVYQFQWKSGQVVLGIVSGTTVVSIYAIGVMLGTYYAAFSAAISSLFLPRATKMVVNQVTPEELTSQMIQIGRASLLVLLFILGAFMLYGRQFISLWIGAEYMQSWLIALCIMITLTIPLIVHFGQSILEAQKKVAFKAKLLLISVTLGTIMGALLSVHYGAIGMVAGTAAASLISQNIMNIYYHKVLKLNMWRFYKEVSRKTVAGLGVVLALGYIIDFIPGTGWINFFLKASFYTLIYSIVMYKFGMIDYEKQLAQNLIGKVSTRFKLNHAK